MSLSLKRQLLSINLADLKPAATAACRSPSSSPRHCTRDSGRWGEARGGTSPRRSRSRRRTASEADRAPATLTCRARRRRREASSSLPLAPPRRDPTLLHRGRSCDGTRPRTRRGRGRTSSGGDPPRTTAPRRSARAPCRWASSFPGGSVGAGIDSF